MEKTLKNIHTVSSLTYEIKFLFEEKFKFIQVKGEVSNLKKQQSGHIYFTLKDNSSAISVALFSRNIKNNFIPKDGDEILITGEISVYAPRGSYQIIAKTISRTGTGDLLMKLHMLKEDLKGQGYFDTNKKKNLPKYPKKIGVVTSSTGAVIKDIINVLSRRFPNFNLILNPVAVQGAGAENEIAKAIADFNKYNLVDVIIVGRGGGSLEDLFCFNEKIVADAIYHSDIPIISACGHETDFTIADFVADVRAPTPSAAAEIVVVDKSIIKENLYKIKSSIQQLISSKIKYLKQNMIKMQESRYLQSPYSILSIFIQNIDDINNQLVDSIKRVIKEKRDSLSYAKKNFQLSSPIKKIQTLRDKTNSLTKHLHSINPRNILKKGYSIVQNKKTKKIISSYKLINSDEDIYIQFAQGSAQAKISNINKR